MECEFEEPWVGKCKNPATQGSVCDDHAQEMCHCGKQATTRCDTSMGLMCGFLIVKNMGVVFIQSEIVH